MALGSGSQPTVRMLKEESPYEDRLRMRFDHLKAPTARLELVLAYLDETEQAQAISQQSFHRFTPHTLTDACALRDELQAIRARETLYAGWFWGSVSAGASVSLLPVSVLPTRKLRWAATRASARFALRLAGVYPEVDGEETLRTKEPAVFIAADSLPSSAFRSFRLPMNTVVSGAASTTAGRNCLAPPP